jgi:hypothetical protein
VSVARRILDAGRFGIESEDILTASSPDTAANWGELFIYDVTKGIVNELRIFLESSENDGGRIKHFHFDESTKAACVTFDDPRGKFLTPIADLFSFTVLT